MNIIKIQDQLKGVPDDALIGYVQNPTGQVPTYLALSELQRRKTMRDTYQQAQPAQTTVAEDLAAPTPMQQGAPTMPADQGVAALPTGDMYQEQNFAGGGIVAFDNGGDVDLTTRSRFDTLTDEEKQVIAAANESIQSSVQTKKRKAAPADGDAPKTKAPRKAKAPTQTTDKVPTDKVPTDKVPTDKVPSHNVVADAVVATALS